MYILQLTAVNTHSCTQTCTPMDTINMHTLHRQPCCTPTIPIYIMNSKTKYKNTKIVNYAELMWDKFLKFLNKFT